MPGSTRLIPQLAQKERALSALPPQLTLLGTMPDDADGVMLLLKYQIVRMVGSVIRACYQWYKLS